MAVSNGYLESVTVDTVTGRKTWHWVEEHPIATYLMALSIAKYNEMPDTSDSRIVYYVYRGTDSLSAVAFQNVDQMMVCYESLFGPYPYDKFSFVVTPLGDMEHQTCVFHARWLMDDGTLYEDILAHELSHQWFGDYTTYADWRDVWLSEGFATYSEALWREYKNGAGDYRTYVRQNLMQPYLNGAAANPGPIYDPAYLWGVLSYEKGGTVLHMLRHVMGDSLFFASLNAYKAAHPHGTATTPDFVNACEGVYGSSLDWFFDEWIYSGGHPIFEWCWDSEEVARADYQVEIQTRQVQTIGPIFTMPVDFRIETAGGDTTVVAWVDAETNHFSFVVPEEPTDVVFDPDNWLLDENDMVPTSVLAGAPAPGFSLGQCRPNPFNPVTTIPFSLPSPGRVTLQVFSIQGGLIRTLMDGESLPAGRHSVRWDGTDSSARPVSSGVYLYRLSQGERRETRKMLLVH
jgi:aminopeptidase N